MTEEREDEKKWPRTLSYPVSATSRLWKSYYNCCVLGPHEGYKEALIGVPPPAEKDCCELLAGSWGCMFCGLFCYCPLTPITLFGGCCIGLCMDMAACCIEEPDGCCDPPQEQLMEEHRI